MSVGLGLALIIGYALGSIPVALIVAELHGVDIYQLGDGNPGAWNTFELREFKWAARVGIFGFPFFQVFFDPAGQVLATAALMSIIGLRYLVARRRGRYAPARSAPVGSR